MPKVIGVFDGGTAVIKQANVGVIIFRTQENESKPVDNVGYCRLNYKDSIIKYLKKIHWQDEMNPEVHEENKTSEDENNG